MIDLSENVALVTGASGGIGEATAQVLAVNGADVVVTHVVDGIEETAEDVEAAGSNALAKKMDVTDENEVKAVVEATREEFGRLDILHERLSGPAETVATDGGRTGDVRDRLVVDDGPQSQDDLEPRTQRAVNEAMDVSLLSKGGRYEVQSASGRWYEVDVISESCTCPDWQQRTPEGGCKHMRRVDHEIKRGRVPRPDGRLPSD